MVLNKLKEEGWPLDNLLLITFEKILAFGEEGIRQMFLPEKFPFKNKMFLPFGWSLDFLEEIALACGKYTLEEDKDPDLLVDIIIIIIIGTYHPSPIGIIKAYNEEYGNNLPLDLGKLTFMDIQKHSKERGWYFTEPALEYVREQSW